MATKPSLHDIFLGRQPAPSLADIAYGNLIDAHNASEARKARALGRDVGLPGETVAADMPGFEQEAFNSKTLGMLGNDPALTRFLVDPGNAAAAKDDLPSLSDISSILKVSDGGDNPLENYMRNTRLGQRRSLLSALGMQAQPQDNSLGGLIRRSRATPPNFDTAVSTPPERPHALDDRYRGLLNSTFLPGVNLGYDPPVTLDEWLGGTADSVFANFEGAALGGATLLGDTVGKGDAIRGSAIYKSLKDQMDRDQAYTQYVADREPSWFTKQIYGASQSLALMGASIATKRPLTAMTLQAGTQEYQQVRDRGGTPDEALAAGTVTGVAEGAFERYFGLGWMLGNVGKAVEKKALGHFVTGLMMREVPSEVATTGVQDLADALVTGGEGWDSYVKRHTELSGDNPLIQTAAQTALLVGLAGGPAVVAQHLSGERRSMDDISRAQAGGEFLDNLMAAAEKSKVKQEDPHTLRDFVAQRTEDSPVRNVYVPVEAAVSYMQSDDYGGELEPYKDQIAQAQATQGDVVIPIADAVAHLSGTPAWEALKDEARVEPGGLSRKEASVKTDEIMAVLEQRGKEIAQEAESTRGRLDGAAEVYVEVKNRLRVAGIDEKQADAMAQVYAARYEARASRRGGTPMEQFKRSKIVFPGENADGTEKGRAFAQAPTVNIGLDVNDGSKITPEEATKALRAAGVKVTASEVHQSGTEPTLVAQLDRALTPKEAHKVSVKLKQDAIAQHTGVEGALHGPAAEKWGPFNPAFFLRLGDRTAQDGMPEAGWTPERVSGLIDAYGQEDGSSSAVAVMMSPDEYLGLMASKTGRKLIASDAAERYGPLDLETLRNSPPIVMRVKLGASPSKWQIAEGVAPPPMVFGHDGRHRMTLLKEAGITRVPVVVQIANSDGRPARIKDKTDIEGIIPNRSRSDQTANGDLIGAIHGGVPISWKFRDQIEQVSERVLFQPVLSPLFRETERRADGTILLEYHPSLSSAPIPIKLAIDDGAAEIAIDQFSTRANRLGPAKVREAMHELLRMYPEIRSFGGFRRSGAGKGRVQEIELFQDRGDPRGRTSLTDSGTRIIELFGTANRSTLLHETGHIWLEELRDDALAEDATDQDKADWATVAKWFKANGHPLTKSGFIPTQAHELWARGVERYFMEGKPPTEGLRSVFHTFRAWLLRIYQVVQNLHSPITPEVREVMSRLLATQEAIDDARRQNATEALFKTAEEAGMTDKEFADYQTRVANARDEAYDTLLYKTMEAIRRRKLAEVREQRASIRAEVAQEVNSQPQYRLLHLLRTGKWLGEPEREAVDVKLNTGWLIDNFGEDVLDKLPKGLPLYRASGIDGDEVAEMVGMASGAEVVHTLLGMRAASDELRARGETRSMRDVLIANETDRIMSERHGDTFDDGTIEEEAIAALNTARQGEIIASEARQLAKRKHVLGVPTPYQFAREWARRTVSAGHVRDVASRSALQRYVRASNKAARLAEEAILKGDIDEAYRQKQAQLLNHALLAEAKAAAERVDRIVARMRKLAKRAAMKSVDPEYLEKIHMLLEDYDFRPRSQRSIDEQKDFQEWLERQRAQGFEVHIPPRLENNGDPYTRVSVQELDSLNDLVESLLKLGRMKQKIVTAQKERDFAEFRDEVLAHIKQLPDRKASKERWWKSGKLSKNKPINEPDRYIAGAAAELLKVETIIEDLDGGPTGPLHDAIVLGATNAENKRFDLRAKVLLPLAQTYRQMGRKQWRRLQERVTIPELTWNSLNEGDPRIGQPVTITRMELLSVLMNMGNLSNLEKLSKGERWKIETLRAVMDREMTKEDFDLAQKMWDQVGLLWPDIVATEGKMAGVVPEQVVAAPINTQFGEYAGGYWPVVYDPARWQLAEDLETKQLDDMFGIKTGVATQKGHTVTRTGAFGPIQLSLENVLFRHIEQVVTRIAFAEYARDVLRIVRDRSIRGYIDTKLGPEYRKQIEKWLARQVHEGAVFAKAARWWEGALRHFRVNMTIAAMGFRFSTGLAQTLGLSASAHRIGSYWVGVGLKRLALSPRENTAFVYARSPEMLHRTEAVNREVAEVARKMRGKHGLLTEAQHWAMWHIGFMDRYTVSMPTWLGAHAKGMKEGMTDEQASAFADKTVRQSQGSGREKDLAAIQSPNSEAMRFWTMFYTPWNVLFNAQWQAARGVKEGNVRPLIAVTWWWLIVGTMGDAMLSGDWPKDDKDPMDWAGWFTRNFAFGLFAGIPLARDAANYAESKMIGQYASDVGTTPITRASDSVEKAFKAGKNKIVKGEDPQRPIKLAGDLTAVLLGVPTSQLGTTGQFAWDVHQGNTHPETISDWYFGITRDKKPKAEEAAQ